ncbi:hypothetical protein RCL1_003644 [Eukaryota sp. TZLM3-RCL]
MSNKPSETRKQLSTVEIKDWHSQPTDEDVQQFRRNPPKYSREVHEIETGPCHETERIYYEPVYRIREQTQKCQRSIAIREPISEHETEAKREMYELEEKELPRTEEL